LNSEPNFRGGAISRNQIKRYNAGIQRARGLLELASGLYDSSLATETWKGAEKVLQTDTPSGNTLKLTLTAKPNDRKGICGRRL